MTIPSVNGSHGDGAMDTERQSLNRASDRRGDRGVEIAGDALKSTIVSGDGNTIVVYYQSRLETSTPSLRSTTSPSTLASNPYKGLLAFQVEDAERFFGRETQVERLWDKFRQLHEASAAGETVHRLLTVLGPSGSGKSSLVRAGLIPELARRSLPGRERMQVSVVKPDAHPLESLALVLARVATGDPSPVSKAREFEGELKLFDGLRRIASALPQTDASALIVVVDQFEETFSLCKDSNEQTAFVENLLTAASDPAGKVSVVLCLRSDFLGATQRYLKLNQVIAENGLIVPAMGPDELRRAIECPAEQAGHPLDVSTVNLLIDQAGDRGGVLPLLQFALLRIWEGLAAGKEPGTTLEEIGGVGGALAGEAQRIYGKLDPIDQNIARRVFLGLVQLGREGNRDTRRCIEIAKLVSSKDNPQRIRKVINRFCDPGARLITLSSSGGGKDTAEVTHEALFEHWGLLREWLGNQRNALSDLRKIEASADQWQEKGRQKDYLLQGRVLKDAERYQKEMGMDLPLSSIATGFVERSRLHSIIRVTTITLLSSIAIITVLYYSSVAFLTRALTEQGGDIASTLDTRVSILKILVNNLGVRNFPILTLSNVFTNQRGQIQPTEGISAKNASFECVSFKSSYLQKADLSYARLYGADFGLVNFYGANFEGAKLSPSTNCYSDEEQPRRVDLGGAILTETNFNNANLTKANLTGAQLLGANFNNAVLDNADMRGAYLYFAHLRKANLKDADIGWANLSGANLSGANLSGVNLREADLSGADLSRANLSGADLSGADLSGANLSGANLSKADLGWVNFMSHTEFGVVKGLTVQQVNSGKNWQSAKFDDDFRKKLPVNVSTKN